MLIISPPFGNYIQTFGAWSVIGTYTLNSRSGRFSQALKTVRRVNGGWINQIGLRNKGVSKATKDLSNKILSLWAKTDQEWDELLRYVVTYYSFNPHPVIELNLSCPNEDSFYVNPLKVCKLFKQYFSNVIVKLPPINYLDIYDQAQSTNVNWFHCCNSYPTPIGGVSGKPLQEYSLAVVKKLRSLSQEITIIGGGGISTVGDIRLFKQAGANHISISSALFNPKTHWNLKKLVIEAK